MNRFDLTGKRAFVTGANTGIGQAIAVDLARAGAHVIAVGRSSMDDTLAAVADAGGKADALQADLATVSGAVAAFDAAVTTHGAIDILVNNAGIIRRADSLDFTEDDWDAVMDINLKVVFFLSQAFAKARLAHDSTGGNNIGRDDTGPNNTGPNNTGPNNTGPDNIGGSIINIASLLSFQGGIRIPSYTASKSGVAGLTKILCNEWSAHGITVNAVAPGYVVTNNTTALREDPARNKAILDRIPAGRWAQADDISGAVTFLASDAARYVSGVTLPVDGGWLAR